MRQLRNNSIRRTITLITAEMYILGITFQKCNFERPIVQMHMYSTYINGVTFSNHLNFEVPNYPSHTSLMHLTIHLLHEILLQSAKRHYYT